MADSYTVGPPPAIDPELRAPLSAIRAAIPGGLPSVSSENLAWIRAGFPGTPAPAEEHFARGGRFEVSQTTAPGRDGNPDVPLLICRPANATPRGCLVYLHGGGMVLGSNVNGVDEMLDYAEGLDLAVVSVEYRLAPENPHPAPLDDCWAALAWVAEHEAELGIPADRLVIAGESAGGGLATATALIARDRGFPSLRGQLLIAPMLDHRSNTPSMQLLGDAGMWDRASNRFGWAALLGDASGDDTSAYASPSRATDLSNLPPAFVDVGGADAFRDEAIDYAARISRAGGLVDLHVWAGAYHGFDGMAPSAQVSRMARTTRAGWLARILPTSDSPAEIPTASTEERSRP